MNLSKLTKGAGGNLLGGAGAREKTEFSTVGIVASVGGAIILDIVSVFPVLNILTGIINWVIFGALFWYKGVNRQQVYGLRNLLLRIAEFIPFISIFPLVTISVIIIIKKHNKEVRAEIAAKNAAQEQEQQEAEESAVAEMMQ